MSETRPNILEGQMTDEFIAAHTQFGTFGAFWLVATLAEVPVGSPDWDRFIAENTDFGSWEEMVRAATIRG